MSIIQERPDHVPGHLTGVEFRRQPLSEASGCYIEWPPSPAKQALVWENVRYLREHQQTLDPTSHQYKVIDATNYLVATLAIDERLEVFEQAFCLLVTRYDMESKIGVIGSYGSSITESDFEAQQELQKFYDLCFEAQEGCLDVLGYRSVNRFTSSGQIYTFREIPRD